MKNKKRLFGIIFFVIGLTTLISGVVFLLINLLGTPNKRDVEYLVEIGAWQLQDEPTVIWDFSEVGKGKLTTNFYINEYDFIWAMDGNTLKIETNWLYTLNNDYTYILDQSAQTLTLMNDDETFTFIPAPLPQDAEEQE